MGEKIQPKGGIYKVKFGYHFKMGGYTALMPDMPKLGVMHSIGISNNILQIIGVDKYEKANQNHT
ncbi:MAG: hypothetical protein KAT65_12440 [Methanophagales archaeon]|nr:hypothetical protein [Methanophagales archaeon]